VSPETGERDLWIGAAERRPDGGARTLELGDAVEFDLGFGEFGPEAVNLRRLDCDALA
jgi:cold shock CspA family protein